MVNRRPRPPTRVLVVCRFNQARSPLAAQLLRDWAKDSGLSPPPVVSSSGLYAEPNQILLREVTRVLAARGSESPDRLSRRFRLQEARSAALVITFERALLRDIVLRDSALTGRTFTLKELRRIAASPLWDEAWNGTAELAMRLHRLRPRVPAGDDDTPDPTQSRGRNVRRVLGSVVEDTMAVAPVVLGGHSGRSGP